MWASGKAGNMHVVWKINVPKVYYFRRSMYNVHPWQALFGFKDIEISG